MEGEDGGEGEDGERGNNIKIGERGRLNNT